MKIIGIDPGTLHTGFGIIEKIGNSYNVIDYGVISPPKSMALEKRYCVIYSAVEHLLNKYKPQALAIETQFVHKNVQSAIKLGMARGVCVLAAAQKDILVKEFAPTLVKKAVVGKGHAIKSQMVRMVKLILNIESDLKEDAADALAIAICHLHSLHLDDELTQSIGR